MPASTNGYAVVIIFKDGTTHRLMPIHTRLANAQDRAILIEVMLKEEQEAAGAPASTGLLALLGIAKFEVAPVEIVP